MVHGEGRDGEIPQHDGDARREGTEVAPLGQITMNTVRAIFPALGVGVDRQRPRLVWPTAPQQAHRKPVELSEMVEVRMGEQDLVNYMHTVALLKLQERRHDAHAAVDELVPHDLALQPLAERVRDIGQPARIPPVPPPVNRCKTSR